MHEHIHTFFLNIHINTNKHTLIHMPALTQCGPLIARLSNNHDALSWGALAGFAFHMSLVFKDTQGREWNHLSQREARRLEAPPAEKPVYFGCHNSLGYECVCVCVHQCACFSSGPSIPTFFAFAYTSMSTPMYAATGQLNNHWNNKNSKSY